MNYTFELKELQATHIVYLHHQGDMSLIQAYAMGRAKRTYKRSGK